MGYEMKRIAFVAALVILIAVFTLPGSPPRDAIFGDGDEPTPEFTGEVNPIPSPVRVVDDTAGVDEATPGPDGTAEPTPACHPIEVVIDGQTYFLKSGVLQERMILHAAIKLTTEDDEFIELPGATVEAIYTRQCGQWDGRCDTLWLVTIEETAEERGSFYIEAIVAKEEPGRITWENIYSGEETDTSDFSQAEATGQFCRWEST
jgi:hypothetical protein